MKKVIYTIVFLLLFLTSCKIERPQYEDFIPDESEYSSWDGNYFYYANYRCKSDGKDEEQLVKEIVIENTTYEVIYCVDYQYIENDLYMVVMVRENVDSSNSKYFAFVVYDLFYKEVKSQTKIGNVGSSYNIDMIIEINNDKVLVEISSSPNHSLYEIDIKKQECQKIIEGAQQISVLDDYIVYKKNTNLYLGKKYEYDFLNMYKCTNNENISISLVNKNDKKYIKIIEHQKNRIEKLKIENYNSLGYYDIEKKVVYKLLDINECKTILNQYEDYVVIGKHYHNPEYCFDSLIVDNEIYKIDYDSDVSLTKIFKTNDSKREYHILEIKENIIKFNVNYYNRAYYEQNKIRYYDLSKSRFLLFVPKVYEKQEENEISIYENIVRFGNENSNYIIEYKVYRRGLMDNGEYAYYFYRVDDGKELCNFYFGDYSNKCDTKFYELFLSNYAPNDNDFKPDHFQIRNY